MAIEKKTVRKTTRKPVPEILTGWPFDATSQAPTLAEQKPVEPETKITDLDYLDLRAMPLFFRAVTLQTFANEGYIWSTCHKPPLFSAGDLSVEVVSFNHANKLIIPVMGDMLPADAKISLATGEVKVDIQFTKPQAIIPDTISANGATYLRIA